MRIVHGWICVAETNSVTYLFGKPISLKDQTYESLETNGITPFDSAVEAKGARESITETTDFKRIMISEIQLEIAESETDIRSLEGRKALIVILQNEPKKPIRLIGPRIEGKPSLSPLPGANFLLNGLKHFKYFSDAYYAAKEVSRKSGFPAYVAAISIWGLTTRA